MLGAYFHQLLIYVFKDEKNKIMKKGNEKMYGFCYSYEYSAKQNLYSWAQVSAEI